MGPFDTSIDPLFLRILFCLFILGVCVFCLRQVADVLERQNRIRELEERVRLRKAERPRGDGTH